MNGNPENENDARGAAPEPAAPAAAARPAPVLEDGAMRTGEGADDEPEMAIGDRFDDADGAEPPLTVEEAERLLPAPGGDAA